MIVYKYLDLLDVSAARDFWSKLRRAALPFAGPPHSGDGYLSPMGYHFFEPIDEVKDLGEPGVYVCSPDEWTPERSAHYVELLEYHSRARATRNTRVSRDHLGIPSATEHGLAVHAGPECVQVVVDKRAWNDVRPGALLAAAQCLRFTWIDTRLDELSDWIEEATPSRRRSRGALWPPARAALRARERSLRSLLLDLPRFEAPLTDPHGFFTERSQARVYQLIARRLRLHAWRNAIDERVEVLEEAIGALVERQAAFDQTTLEVLILVALLADLAFNAFVTLWWGE